MGNLRVMPHLDSLDNTLDFSLELLSSVQAF